MYANTTAIVQGNKTHQRPCVSGVRRSCRGLSTALVPYWKRDEQIDAIVLDGAVFNHDVLSFTEIPEFPGSVLCPG
jgi:hypothetical protein